MIGGPSVQLERQRDLGTLLSETFALYREHFGTLIRIAAAVVIPVNLIVLGIGLEQLSAGYDETPGVAQTAVPAATGVVTTPLVLAMTIAVLLDLRDGRAPSAGSAIQRGLDAFAPIFAAVVIALAGVILGLLALVLPGIYLAIRWYFVTQAVVVDGARGTGALRRSAELVRGNWWRVLGITIVMGLIVTLAGLIVAVPLEAAAQSADSALLSLLGATIADVLTAPFAAVLLTLLYFDLRWRHRGEQIPREASRPPDPPGLPPQA